MDLAPFLPVLITAFVVILGVQVQVLNQLQ